MLFVIIVIIYYYAMVPLTCIPYKVNKTQVVPSPVRYRSLYIQSCTTSLYVLSLGTPPTICAHSHIQFVRVGPMLQHRVELICRSHRGPQGSALRLFTAIACGVHTHFTAPTVLSVNQRHGLSHGDRQNRNNYGSG